jgi:hypothetical protein
MQRPSRFTLALLALGPLVLPGSTAHAQTTASGPHYAATSWDRTLPVATRFIVLSNFAGQAVLDRETGLVWERSPDSTRRSLRQAATSCHDRNVGGRKGWRLPAIAELASLVDPGQADPALPAGHPFANVQFNVPVFQVLYWSSTGFPEEAGSALPPFPPTVDTETLNFHEGTVSVANSRASSLLAWCVRGPGGDDGR